MKKKLATLMLAGVVCSALALAGCGEKNNTATSSSPASTTTTTAPAAAASSESPSSNAPLAEAPGESGFVEIKIGEEQIVGPYQVAAVYFQSVDMIPEGRQLSAAESDMHLEADIHLTPESAKAFGFGNGEDIWPAYLTVEYKVETEDGKEVDSGVFMPMNADDGAHYGTNIKKGAIPVGRYKLTIEMQPSQDYLLHVDPETGVPAAADGSVADAQKYYEKQTVTFDWNYDGSQLQNK